jgi:ElaB/YqjD/DUF883 family membrane-anchored ribosome-binding protein
MEMSLLETYDNYEPEALILRSDIAMTVLLQSRVGLQANYKSINRDSYEIQLLRRADLLTIDETSITLSQKGQEFLNLLGIESDPVRLSEAEQRQPSEIEISTTLDDRAKGYGAMIAEAASSAKDYVADKVSVIGDKLADLKNTDIKEVSNQAKDYARQNPGQAILISVASGFIMGLLARNRRH